MTDDKQKSQATSKPASADAMTNSIIEYLRQHPGFFNEHPELLSQLHIPHDSGDAVSLIERQMSVLREQNQLTRQKLRELIEIAQANEELARRMHMLALTLMDAKQPAEIFTLLYESLRSNFTADFAVVRVFGRPLLADFADGDEFVGADAKGAALFKSVIDSKRPICGQLKHQQQVYLFDDTSNAPTSGVMVPLAGDGWSGIMAIGSHDPERFQPGMGVDLLTNLGEILSLILKPWVVSAKS